VLRRGTWIPGLATHTAAALIGAQSDAQGSGSGRRRLVICRRRSIWCAGPAFGMSVARDREDLTDEIARLFFFFLMGFS
jgi:hypothetical protein